MPFIRFAKEMGGRSGSLFDNLLSVPGIRFRG